MERFYSFPKDAKHFHLFEADLAIKNHTEYKAAKSGDPESAFRLIAELAVDFIRSLDGQFPHHVNYNGGNVLGSITLVNAGRIKKFIPDKKHIRLLEERFGDEITKLSGCPYHFRL